MSRKTGRNAIKNAAKRVRVAAKRPDYSGIRTAGGRGISGLALGAMALSGPLHAADDVPAPSTDKGDNTLQEVVVTGIRASLQKSLDIKQQSVGVVDAISAEDIGQFPDSNLGAALQRIPGVSISRASSSIGGVPTTTGDATSITVRGFGPSFNETLLDGRKAATAANTLGRGFDFSAVGADYVGEVDILKTPDASLSSGAIGATINIKYPKPFDSPGLKFHVSGAGIYSPDEGKVAPNGGFLFSDTFADDTFGILVDADFAKHDVRGNHVNIQGWEGVVTGPDSGQMHASQYAGAPPPDGSPNWFIQDYGIYQEDTDDKRVDGRAVFQWRPTDALLVTLNGNYSQDKIRQVQYGYSVWFNSGSLTDITRAADGTLTSFTQPNTPTDFQGQVNASVLRNLDYGLNVAWDVTSSFKAELDAAQSTSKLNPGGELSSIDVDVGYGPSGDGGTNGTNVGIAGVGSGSLPYPTNIGPNGNAAQFINNGLMGSHVLPIVSQRNNDIVNQFKVMGTWSEDQTQLRFGMQFVQDTQDRQSYDTFTNNQWQAYAGYGPASNNTGGVALPQNLFTNSFSTSNFINGFSNNGNLPPNILAFSPYAVLNYLQSLPASAANACCMPAFNGTYQVALNAGSVQTIREKTYSPFISLSQETKIGSMPLRTSLGVRYDQTYLTSTGLGRLPIRLDQQASDLTAFATVFGPTQPIVEKNSYKYVLPNLDLNLNITDTLKARFDASRTLTRPPLNLITPVLNVPTNPRTNALTATGGNPDLLPFTSDNLDLGAEWYYAPNSYVSVDGFLKEVTNFIVGGTDRETINDVVDPTTGKAALWSVTKQVNGPTAQVRGVEVGVQHMLWDTGFGLQANATFVSTNKPYNPNDTSVSGFAVTGLANSANFVAFFEKWGLHARVAVNWRDEYLDRIGQLQNGSQFGTEPTFVNSSTQVDFSSSYDINNHFNVYFEAINLNDSTFSTHGRFKDQVLDVVDFGRRFTLGVHAKL
jgi:iron complex outermembrane recepter protein